MSNFITNASAINSYTVQSSDGFQSCTPAGGYLQLTSSGSATVDVKTPLALNGLTTGNQGAEDAWRSTKETTAFWNPNATNLLADLDGTIGEGTTLATGTYTSPSRAINGDGSGATFDVTGVQNSNRFILTSVVVNDHGDGYRLGDRLTIIVEDEVEYIITMQTDNDGAVFGWKTADTTTSFTDLPVVSNQYGTDGVATITVVHNAATTNGDAYSTLTDVAFTTGGSLYQSGEETQITIDFSDGDVVSYHNVKVGKGFSDTIRTEMTSGQFLPFIITEFKNIETSDDTFILVV